MLVVRQCLCTWGSDGQGNAHRKDQPQHWRRFFFWVKLGENMSAQVDAVLNMSWATPAFVAVVLTFVRGLAASCTSRWSAIFFVGEQGACSFQEASCHVKQGPVSSTEFSHACRWLLPVSVCIGLVCCCSTALGTSMSCSRCVSNCVIRRRGVDEHVFVVSSCALCA